MKTEKKGKTGKKTQKIDESQLINMLTKCKKADLARICGVTQRTIQNWKNDFDKIGARNRNGTVNAIKVIQWRLAENREVSNDKTALQLENLKKDIELKEQKIIKIQENYIERSIAEQRYTSFCRAISQFFQKSPSFWKQYFHMVHADVAEQRLALYGKEACEQLANAPEINEE